MNEEVRKIQNVLGISFSLKAGNNGSETPKVSFKKTQIDKFNEEKAKKERKEAEIKKE